MSKTLTIYLAADIRKLSSGLRNGQQDLRGFAGHVDRLGSTLTGMLGPAMIGAGIAAGAMAAKFAVDGVQAFMADEAAAAKLATTLDNLGLAHDTAEVESMIDALQRETGVADDALRPAFDRLVRSIGDTKLATDALQLAMDVSAGTGKSLDSVVQALGRAYDGNTAGLSRLGAGIDKGVLATGNMQAITRSLADTFSGQAKTAANTYEGQLARLSVGFDELKESFGRGFLSGLTDADDKTGDLLVSLQNLEPKMEKLGAATFDVGVFAIDAATALLDFKTNVETLANFSVARFSISLIRNADALNLISDEAGAAAEAEYQLYLATNNLIGEMDPAARAAYALQLRYQGLAAAALAAANATSTGIDQQAVSTSRWNAIAQANDAVIKTNGGNLSEWLGTLKQTETTTGGTSTVTDTLTAAYTAQSDKIRENNTELERRAGLLDDAIQKATDYKATLSSQILGGVDLTAAQEAGEGLAGGTLSAFNNQIAQAEWFGNVLQEIKRQGADEALIDQIASMGPAAGGKLAQSMIDDGLVLTFNDRLNTVTETANKVAQAMVPEWIQAGIDSAEGNLNSLLATTEENMGVLKKMGKHMGKTVGSNMAAEIAKAVAKAVADAEAAKTAAAAERAAQAAADRVVTSEQQTAQAFARIVQNSNARGGYSMGVPVPTPVI